MNAGMYLEYDVASSIGEVLERVQDGVGDDNGGVWGIGCNIYKRV